MTNLILLPFGSSPLSHVDRGLGLVLQLLRLVGLHLPRVVEHLDAEDDHDGDGGVEGVDLRDQGGHAPAEQGGHDGHQYEGGDGAQEDGQLVIAHGKNGWK